MEKKETTNGIDMSNTLKFIGNFLNILWGKQEDITVMYI